MKNLSIAKSVCAGIIAVVALALVGCGGRAASTTPGTSGSPSSGNGTIQIALTDTSGVVKSAVTSGSPLTAKATVTDDAGAVLANKVVTFTLGATLATLAPTSGTALTDAQGVAQVTLQSAGTGGGADIITASVSVGSTPVTASTGFSVGADPSAVAAAVNFVVAVPSDKSIVLKGSGGNGRTEVALLTFKVIDVSGNGVVNQSVNFTTQSSQPVGLVTASGITGQDGQVTVSLSSGTAPTTVRVIATIPGLGISGISDQVTVTTGAPVQAFFSISASTINVEGWNFDAMPSTINILLADAFGGAVADGTQVVFTTDSGSIAGTGGAMCLTTQGACSVTWRSQSPRLPTGKATITATAASGGANLAVTQVLCVSGSYPQMYQVAPGSTPGATTRLNAANASVGPLDFSASCEPQTLLFELVDVNNNPMPLGTTLAIAEGAANVTATITPSTVANGCLVPLHTVVVTPTNCSVGGTTTTLSGAFDFLVTTPQGVKSISTHVSLGAFPSP